MYIIQYEVGKILLLGIVCELSCENGGTPDTHSCTDCYCPEGYTGTRCDQDIDECSDSQTCSNGVCTNSIGGYSCSCFTGYTGEHCEVNIDECYEGTHICENGGTCIDKDPGYKCACRDGTSGQTCENCALSGCKLCATEKDPVLCNQCELGYFLFNGYCGKYIQCRTSEKWIHWGLVILSFIERLFSLKKL